MDELLQIAYDAYLLALESPRSPRKLEALHGGLSRMLKQADEKRHIVSIQQQGTEELFSGFVDDEFEYIDGEWKETHGFFSKDIDITCMAYAEHGVPAPFSYTQVKFPASNISQNYRNYIEGGFGDMLNLKHALQGEGRMLLSEFWIMPVNAPYFSKGVMKKVDVIEPYTFIGTIADAYRTQSEGVPDYYSLNFIELAGLDRRYIGATREDIMRDVESYCIELVPYEVELPSSASSRLMLNDPWAWAAYMTGNAYASDYISNPIGVYNEATGEFYCSECGWDGRVVGGMWFEYCPGCGAHWNV